MLKVRVGIYEAGSYACPFCRNCPRTLRLPGTVRLHAVPVKAATGLFWTSAVPSTFSVDDTYTSSYNVTFLTPPTLAVHPVIDNSCSVALAIIWLPYPKTGFDGPEKFSDGPPMLTDPFTVDSDF